MRPHDLAEVDDVVVLQHGEQLDLPDGRDGKSFLFVVHAHFLQRHFLARRKVLGEVNLSRQRHRQRCILSIQTAVGGGNKWAACNDAGAAGRSNARGTECVCWRTGQGGDGTMATLSVYNLRKV